MTARKGVALAVLVNAACLALLAAWAAAGWPGRPNHLLGGDAFYCEALRPGWIRQPANTLSNFGFIAMGLLLAGRARTMRAWTFALIVSLLGPASMALHAGMTAFGGALDVASMFLFIGFAFSQNAARLSPFVNERFLAFAGAWSALMIALALWGSEHGPSLFASLIALFLLAEAVVSARNAAPERDRRRLACATAFFFAGFACWKLSEHSSGPWCSPRSLIQGHAAWHLLCALAAGAVYWYLEPELDS